MFPNAIDNGARELRRVGLGHPVCQFDPAIAGVAGDRYVAAERRGSERFTGSGMIHFAAGAHFDESVLLRNACEISGEMVVILLRPAIGGMRVTTRTGD